MTFEIRSLVSRFLNRLVQNALRGKTLAPMVALGFGSAVSVALITGRILWTGRFGYAFLVWNLILAWVPLVLALVLEDQCRNGSRRPWAVAGLAVAWLLFFPNAPYICTDVIHLTFRFQHFWVDLTLVLLFAFTGMVLGFLSLYLLQSLVAERFGRVAGWIFVFATASLSSVGVYIGRFLRFNSWDVLLRPARVYTGLNEWSGGTLGNLHSAAFLLGFGAFLFAAYVMLYALTHLSPAGASSRPAHPEVLS